VSEPSAEELAPIALFAYNRPDHLRRSLESLLHNEEAARSDLIVFSDGPRSAADVRRVEEVRALVRQVEGFRSVKLRARDQNLGGPRAIPEGISEICGRFGRIIVVEDDVVVAPSFLAYLNGALHLYADDPQVVCVNGYFYPHRVSLPETFFLRGADNQGWATWSRGWSLFDPDGATLLERLRRQHLVRAFDMNCYPFSAMLEPRPGRPVAPWDVRWFASAFLANGLTLYPGTSLVRNIGFDGSGVHSPVSRTFEAPLADRPIDLHRIPLVEDPVARREFKRFLRREAGWRGRSEVYLPRTHRFLRAAKGRVKGLPPGDPPRT
jgi:hypothetical protein